MNDEDKAKEQLISELNELRQRFTEIEVSETLQERVAEALLKAESQYRSTLDSMGDMIHVIDTELRFILFNTSFKQMNIELGIEIDVLGKKISDVYSFLPDKIFDEYHQVFEAGKVLVTEERITIGGRKFITETRKIPIFEEGRVTQIVTVISDITERKKAEENIKEMKEKYESLIENIPDVIYSALADATSTTTFVSERITDLTGYSPVDFYENDNLWAKCIHPEDRQLAVETFINAYTNKKEYIFEYRMVHKENGQIYHLRDHGVPIRDDDGQIIRFDGILTDISKRKQAEEALFESEEKYRSLFQDSRDAVYFNQKDTIVDANKAMLELFGYSREEMLGMKAIYVYANPEDRAKFLREITQKGSVRDYEVKFRKKNGTDIDCLLTSSVKRDENEDIIGYQGIIRDITERMKLERQLVESEEKYRTLVEKDPNMIYLMKDGKFTFVNQALANTLGYSKEEFLNPNFDPISLLVIPEHKQMVTELMKRRLAGENVSESYEFSIRTKKGEVIPVLINVTSIEMEGKRIIQGVLTDISKVKELKKELKESEERYSSLFEESRDAIFITTREGKLINFNQATIELFGFSREELSKLNVRELYIDPIDRSSFQREIEQKGSVRGYELKLRNKENTEIACLLTATVRRDNNGNIMGYQGIIRDITERNKLERQLIESEEKYRTLVEKDPNMIYLIKDGKVAFANQALLNTLGYSAKEIYDMDLDILSAIVPDQRLMIKERLKKRIAGENVPESYEFSLMTKNGEIIPCLLNTSSFELEGKRIIQGVLTDISKVKELENELKESEERYRGLYNSSIDGIVSADMENIIECNQAFADLLGYTKEEIKQMNYRNLVPSKWHDELRRVLIEPVQKKGYSDEYQLELVKKDGTIIPVSISAWMMTDKEGIGTKGWAIIRDISEKREMEEELHKIEKLESLGILAGGIAHDFNNILTGILGNITLAKLYAPFREKVLERLSEAEKATMRARDLTQQLLTFSQGGAPIKKTASIDELLKDTTVFTLSGSNVICKFSIPEDLWSVEIDEGQISQVINNLIINADQAMPEGGAISISAENVIVGAEDILPLKEGRYIKITIQDQGIGIPEEYLQKIFDPYFTTKQKGSGLGLTIAYSIIKNHKGYIAVKSKLGVGSNFSIYLPAMQTQIPKKKEAEKGPITGKGKIMVMDDEEIIRTSLGEILTFLGYEPEFARNGEEAIAIYKKAKDSEQSFDAVILDLTIRGGMGGKETIKKLIEIDPKVKAIVSSGYSTDPVMADFKNYGFRGVVAKPYDIKELSKELDNVINGKESS